MQPFNNFTTKAKTQSVAHEIAIERRQNQVTPLHMMAGLLADESSFVYAILERLEIDTILLVILFGCD